MRDDSEIEATAARKAYETRPWLKYYPSFMRPELTPRFANGLEMLLATVQTMPEQDIAVLTYTSGTTGRPKVQ